MAEVDQEPTAVAGEPALGSVPVSEERFAALASGVEICHQTIGDPGARPLLLVMGLAGPMTWWPLELCRRLAEHGFYVIRYDNRDSGRSTRLDEHRVTQRDLVRAFFRQRVRVPYSLDTLTEDGLGVLDALGIRAAHVAGVSMGGMIAQTMAIEHPERVLSLTSIMSSTGRRRSGYQDPLLLPQLLKRAGTSREAYVASSVAFWRLISSPGYRGTDEAAHRRAGETYDRGVTLPGIMRQMLAVLTQRDRTSALAGLRVPVTVVHGLQDRMVHVSGGRATAAAVPGAELELVPGMGHDIPEGLFDTFVDAIVRTAARAG
jgi:pimeloyl-ACP methyl ester carboxylesterase